MRHHRLCAVKGVRVSIVMTLLILAVQVLVAQTASRINRAIDDSSLVRIPNSTHPLTARAADLGRVDSHLPMQRMVLVLKPSEAQEAELTKLLDHQHDKNSAAYHQWLTPDEYGRRFGPNEEDLAQIRSWLQQKGFHIDRIARGKQWIEFSGDAAQVEPHVWNQQRGRAMFSVEPQVFPSKCRPCSGNFLRGGQGFSFAREAPQTHEWADGDIKRPVGKSRNLLRFVEHVEQIFADGDWPAERLLA